MYDFTMCRLAFPFFATATLIAADTMAINEIDSFGSFVDRFGVLGAVCVVQWIVIRYIMQRYEKIQADRFLDMERQIEDKNEQVTQLTGMIGKNSSINLRVEKLLNEIEKKIP